MTILTPANFSKLSLGMDPGWKNFGIALLEQTEDKKVKVVKTEVLHPYQCDTHWGISELIYNFLLLDGNDPPFWPDVVGIERFVSYNNVDSAETENILMTIGAAAGYLQRRTKKDPYMYRAFEWKVNLNKFLVKEKGFSNPSTSFNKVFSLAAAKACIDFEYDFKTDHEGDACAIAYHTLVQSNIE